MFEFETSDLIIVLAIVLVIFGLKRLPQMGGGRSREIKGVRQDKSSQEEDT